MQGSSPHSFSIITLNENLSIIKNPWNASTEFYREMTYGANELYKNSNAKFPNALGIADNHIKIERTCNCWKLTCNYNLIYVSTYYSKLVTDSIIRVGKTKLKIKNSYFSPQLPTTDDFFEPKQPPFYDNTEIIEISDITNELPRNENLFYYLKRDSTVVLPSVFDSIYLMKYSGQHIEDTIYIEDQSLHDNFKLEITSEYIKSLDNKPFYQCLQQSQSIELPQGEFKLIFKQIDNRVAVADLLLK